MKRIINWIAYDGLLHFLVCAVISLALYALTECLWASLVVGLLPALVKEYYDVFVECDNNFTQALHDLVCDFAGLGLTMIIHLLKSLI